MSFICPVLSVKCFGGLCCLLSEGFEFLRGLHSRRVILGNGEMAGKLVVKNKPQEIGVNDGPKRTTYERRL